MCRSCPREWRFWWPTASPIIPTPVLSGVNARKGAECEHLAFEGEGRLWIIRYKVSRKASSKGKHGVGSHVVETQTCNGLAHAICQEQEEQLQCVAIGTNGMRARAS